MDSIKPWCQHLGQQRPTAEWSIVKGGQRPLAGHWQQADRGALRLSGWEGVWTAHAAMSVVVRDGGLGARL